MKLIVAKIFGTGFGTGYAPKASGTVGSLLAVVIYWFVPHFSETLWLSTAILIFFVIGVWSGTVLEEIYGHDAGEITIDEFVGQWIALFLLPKTLLAVALAFAFFRVFDIAKPEPVNALQKLPKGWGVMLDDVMAGVYANLTCQIALWLIDKTGIGR
jgi:phosphatidylglycerophosphatase A